MKRPTTDDPVLLTSFDWTKSTKQLDISFFSSQTCKMQTYIRCEEH